MKPTAINIAMSHSGIVDEYSHPVSDGNELAITVVIIMAITVIIFLIKK